MIRAFGGPRLSLHGPDARRDLGAVVAGIAPRVAVIGDGDVIAPDGTEGQQQRAASARTG